MRIRIAQSAHEAITAAVVDGVRSGREDGGSLLAVEGPGVTTILYALPPGPNASIGGAHVVTDGTWQSGAIARVRAVVPAVGYVGDWHVHPFWMPWLSEQDRSMAAAILRDPATARRHLVLLLGTGRPLGPAHVAAFVVRTELAWGVAVEPSFVEAIPDDEAAEVADLGALPPLETLLVSPATDEQDPGEPVPESPGDARSPETESGHALSVPGFAHAAAERIERDLATVRQRLRASARTVAAPGGPLAAHVARDGAVVTVVFPPEYPLGAPLVLRGALDGPVAPVPLPHGWSTLHRLDDVVAVALGDRRAGTGWDPWRAARLPLTGPELGSLGVPRRLAAALVDRIARLLGAGR